MSAMRSGRNDHRRGRDGLRDNGPTHQPAHQAPAGPLTDRCPDDAERSYADHALSRAAREITLPTRSPQRLLREKTRPARVTQPHSRYKTRPAHPFSQHARYKTRPARPKRPNLACFARAWRTFYRFHRQQAVQGELSTVFTANKPCRANFLPFSPPTSQAGRTLYRIQAGCGASTHNSTPGHTGMKVSRGSNE